MDVNTFIVNYCVENVEKQKSKQNKNMTHKFSMQGKKAKKIKNKEQTLLFGFNSYFSLQNPLISFAIKILSLK